MEEQSVCTSRGIPEPLPEDELSRDFELRKNVSGMVWSLFDQTGAGCADGYSTLVSFRLGAAYLIGIPEN